MKRLISNDYEEQIKFRVLFCTLCLIFLNIFIMIPVLLSVWALWLSLGLTSILLMLSLFFVFLDSILIQTFVPSIWFASIFSTGIGLLLGTATYLWVKHLLKIKKVYVRWNFKIVKGQR